MDPWHSNLLRAARPDAVRQWAELEGKSDTMREDLYRQHAAQRTPIHYALTRISVLGEIVVVALEAMWHLRSR